MAFNQHPSIIRKPAPVLYQPYAQQAPNSHPVRQPPPPPSYPLPSPRSVSANPGHSNRLQRHDSPPAQGFPRPSSSSDLRNSRQEYNRPRSTSLAPPRTSRDPDQMRTTSTPMAASPPTSSPYSDDDSSGGKISKRRSWLPNGGRKSRATSQDLSAVFGSPAWIDRGTHKLDYSLKPLVNGNQVPELWDLSEKADVYVYLFPSSTGRGPSFKVPSRNLVSSRKLADQIGKRPRARSFDGRGSLAVEDAVRAMAIRSQFTPPEAPRENPMEYPTSADGSEGSIQSFPESQPREVHLHFPVVLSNGVESQPTEQDVQSLVDIRNLFAFLTGQPLVGTHLFPTRFHIFMVISALLWKFEFGNLDGSTWGEAASDSFGYYLATFQLSDLRDSREKTIEGLILGERMRSLELYQEAFAHAIGKYEDIKAANPNLFNQINKNTLNRLERSFLDLQQRQQSVNRRLTDFQFHSIFSGIANSTSRPEASFVRFKSWKSNFMAIRRMVLSYYKTLHGQWPPKANSKKNAFVEGGLNRLVLKVLYNDFCSLYDLLVNQESSTTRTLEWEEPETERNDNSPGDWLDDKRRLRTASAMRTLLDEFDKSSPPVQPPIPYDTPNVPSFAAVDPTFSRPLPACLDAKGMEDLDATEKRDKAEAKRQNKLSSRKLKDHERDLVLTKSHNRGVLITPFLHEFLAFERKEARGNNCQELADQRYGYWIFLYAVIQSLPMLVIDAPGVKFSDGVEYFLCQPPLGGLPWLSDMTGPKKEWYGVGESNTIVSMPSDIVDYGLEATYNRSHCWIVGMQWYQAQHPDLLPAPIPSVHTDAPLSPLAPPIPVFAGSDDLRPSSRSTERGFGTPPLAQSDWNAARATKRKSIAAGLNKLPIPATVGARQENFTTDFGNVSYQSAVPRGPSPGYYPAGGYNSASGHSSVSGYNSTGDHNPAGGHNRPRGLSSGVGPRDNRMSGNPMSTFDDILKNMDDESALLAAEKKRKKK